MTPFTNYELVAIQAGVLKIHGNILHLREGGWTPFTRITTTAALEGTRVRAAKQGLQGLTLGLLSLSSTVLSC
jgi:hypothetical protein